MYEIDKISRKYTFEPMDDKLFVTEYDMERVVSQMMIEFNKFRDKKILSTLSIEALQNLVNLCNEVIEEKKHDGVETNNR